VLAGRGAEDVSSLPRPVWKILSYWEARLVTRMISASCFDIDDGIGRTISVAEANHLALQMAKRSIIIRRDRRRRFPGIVFEDPNWEMMLDLFIAMEEGRRVSVTSLTIAAQVSSSTGLRCIRRMVQDGHMQRVDDSSDARRSFLLLSPSVYAAMREEMLAMLDCAPGLAPIIGRDARQKDAHPEMAPVRSSRMQGADQDERGDNAWI
jgi:hypothetical protein